MNSALVPELVTPEEAAKKLGHSKRHVLRLAREGKLPRVKLGHRTVMFRPDDLREFIHRHHEQVGRHSQAQLFDEDRRIPPRF